jgi:hypothetical protein
LLIHTHCSSIQHAISHLSLLCLRRLWPGNGAQRHRFLSFLVHVLICRYASHHSTGAANQSQNYVTTDNQSASLSWCQAPPGAQDQICVTVGQLLLCRLQLLLALARVSTLGSDSSGTHDHILLSQILDSPSLEDQVPKFISPINRMALFLASYHSQKKQKFTAGKQPARSYLASGPAGTHGHIFVQCQDLCFVFPFVDPLH